MQYDFYPSFYQHCGRKTQALVILLFLLISLWPLFLDFGLPKQLRPWLLIFTSIIAFPIAFCIDILLSRFLLRLYLKPFRITATQLFIPKWLIYSKTQTELQDLVIDSSIIRRVIVKSYQMDSSKSSVLLLDHLCIKTWARDIYLDGNKLTFNGISEEKSELLQGLKLLPCDIVFEHKRHFGNLRLIHTLVQGRYCTTYTAMYTIIVIICFGTLLWLMMTV